MQPGIHEIDNDAYHSSPGVSRSKLWTLYTRSPAHARFEPKKEATHFDFGRAMNDAVIQPDTFEKTTYCGPDDRRGNKWTNAKEYCEHNNLTLLTGPDYDAVMRARDAILSHAIVREMVDGATIEHAAYHVDDETGMLVKVKPDIWNPRLSIMADVKSAANGGPEEFARSIGKYGYHVQEAMYSDVWHRAGGGDVDGFIFIVAEKDEPFETGLYELRPVDVAEGYAVYRRSLKCYAECSRAEVQAAGDPTLIRAAWPGYSRAVQKIALRKWDFKETEAEPDA